eukprot:2526096-Pleurochrysis_carterae.AAC.1
MATRNATAAVQEVFGSSEGSSERASLTKSCGFTSAHARVRIHHHARAARRTHACVSNISPSRACHAWLLGHAQFRQRLFVGLLNVDKHERGVHLAQVLVAQLDHGRVVRAKQLL